MKPITIAFLPLCICCLPLLSHPERADISTHNETYEDARIVDVGLNNIIILTDEGVLTLQFGELDDETKALFDFDAEKAEAERKQRARRAAERQEEKKRDEKKANILQLLAAERIEANITILQVLNDGILARGGGYKGRPRQVQVSRRVTTYNEPQIRRYDEPRRQPVHNTVYSTREVRDTVSLGSRSFIDINSFGLVDGEYLSRDIWRAGSYSYTNTLGAQMTVRRYTTSPIDFLKYQGLGEVIEELDLEDEILEAVE